MPNQKSTQKSALITGISGQDGSYLAELLLEKGYRVHGIVSRTTLGDEFGKLSNIRAIKDRVELHVSSMDNLIGIQKIFQSARPDECYHLAAPSFVSYSLDDELTAFKSGFTATHAICSALREVSPRCRLYYAGSSEMFGKVDTAPQDESTRFNPRSLYGISKLSGYHLIKSYRDQGLLFACAGFLYNHESPRRGSEFVTRKITSGAARIKLGLQESLALGNLDAERDWGYAPEFVDAMWRMLQQDKPDDYVIATGSTHSVREFVKIAFQCVDLDYEQFVKTDQRFFRPSEKIKLTGDAKKAREILAWTPKKDFSEMIKEMVEAELKSLSVEKR